MEVYKINVDELKPNQGEVKIIKMGNLLLVCKEDYVMIIVNPDSNIEKALLEFPTTTKIIQKR